MFSKILIANRGEIAVRVMRTAKEMGISTVAVYSDADRRALHVLTADEAVYIGPSNPLESYLDADKLIEAARATRAEAIHPGYGFLSENAAFAEKVAEAGLTFIGPKPEVMSRLGDKIEARKLAQASGVPTVPGRIIAETDEKELFDFCEEAGYPVLIKAAAGGGGKGMRVVRQADELLQAARQASNEAASAFSNGSIFLEKYLERPRHIEIQVLADHHGNAVHLFERECSIQRRHQKIIEEAPSPVMDEELRNRMGQAAVNLVRESGYENAGTVEFLLDEDRNFYFLEVNTRLQVEHPITEAITGLDLVKLQLDIASGKPLPFEQKDITLRGHAIECRIYAENPEENFMPAPGKILFSQDPEGPGVRMDSGIYAGFTVPVQYDPILAKLVASAQDRGSAIDRMLRALRETVVLGAGTALEYMADVLDCPPFRKGDTHTSFLEEHFGDWRASRENDDLALIGFAARRLLEARGLQPSHSEGRDSDGPVSWASLDAIELADHAGYTGEIHELES